MEKLHRYKKVCYHENLRGWENENNVEVILDEFQIIRHTPKGYVIKVGLKEKWVSATGKKRFAYPDKSDALENFKRRTTRSIWIMKHNIDYAELALEKANLL